jgi:hypothetical protein
MRERSDRRLALREEAIVQDKQRIRLKPTSPAAREWNVPPGAEGTVLCRYRILGANSAAADRLDVRFGPRLVVWGAPAAEFEAITQPTLKSH